MTAKEKVWQDSGYDCDHCGGRIMQLKARRPVRPNHAYYRCQTCGCEWTFQGDVVHIGNGAQCREAQSRRMAPTVPEETDWLTRVQQIPRWVQVLVGIGLLLLLLRFGAVGGMLLRLLLPAALIAIVVYLVARYGREQEWW